MNNLQPRDIQDFVTSLNEATKNMKSITCQLMNVKQEIFELKQELDSQLHSDKPPIHRMSATCDRCDKDTTKAQDIAKDLSKNYSQLRSVIQGLLDASTTRAIASNNEWLNGSFFTIIGSIKDSLETIDDDAAEFDKLINTRSWWERFTDHVKNLRSNIAVSPAIQEQLTKFAIETNSPRILRGIAKFAATRKPFSDSPERIKAAAAQIVNTRLILTEIQSRREVLSKANAEAKKLCDISEGDEAEMDPDTPVFNPVAIRSV